MRFVPFITVPWASRFTSNRAHVMDELMITGSIWSDRSIRNSIETIAPRFPHDIPPWEPPPKPVRPIPTDVPVPEPFDVPVPEPMDVPPPDPRDIPPPKGRDVPSGQTRPVP